MASLRDVGASIDGSGFDEGWIEALSDLHMEAFLKSERAKSNAEHKTVYDSVIQASVAMNTIPFCAIGPDLAMEHVNKLMKIRGGLKGLTQQPAAMARWFLVAPELSGLATQAEHMVGYKKPHHRIITI